MANSKNCDKVFIQRDYSSGMAVKFEKNIPRELEGKVSREVFEETISRINEFYAKAEELNISTFCEGCFACFTSYLFLSCMKTHYEKCAQRATEYIEEQNKSVYSSLGLTLVDPLQRGLRAIEVVIHRTHDNTITV